MQSREQYDAVIVGSGPNGYAAGIVLARAGLRVLIVEAKERIGGGTKTLEITLPGFHHDICSSIHPLAMISSFFRSVPLAELGVEWADPPSPLVHALDGGRVAVMEKSVEETARRFGIDGPAYRKLFEPFADRPLDLFGDILGPLGIPKHPFTLARFGLNALRSAEALAKRFKTEEARGLFASCAAHAIVPLDKIATASFGLVLLLSGHAAGWPCAKGGSQVITDALDRYFKLSGGEVRTGTPVTSLDELPECRAVLFDLTPRQIVTIAGDALPDTYRRRLQRFRYGPGVFKIDWALSEPVPWKNPECLRAATVHLGGTLEEIAEGERAAWEGRRCETPLVLFVQTSLFDGSRAPAGRHTGWAYCHVPNGSTDDYTEIIEKQVERFAPGFRRTILARSVRPPASMEEHDANYVGGDIGGGANILSQVFTRPVARLDPYSTPNPKLFICSSSTPPGGGVHGMCGYYAARSVLKKVFGKPLPF